MRRVAQLRCVQRKPTLVSPTNIEGVAGAHRLQWARAMTQQVDLSYLADVRAPTPAKRRLHCPFEGAIHADVEGIQLHAVTWAVEQGLVRDAREAARLSASKVGWLVARANPSGDREAVELAADWTTFFCLLDDRIERLPGRDTIAPYLERALAALSGGSTREDAFLVAAGDIGRRFRARASVPLWEAFERENAKLFAMFVVEAEARACGGAPDVASYLAMREVTVGVGVELILSELAAGLSLTKAEREAMADMARMAKNLVGWENDLFTHLKERVAGDPNNLVLLLAAHQRLDLAAAAARVARMHDRDANALALRVAEVERGGSAGARRYAAILGAWVSGHLAWARETGRYDA